MNVQIFLLRFFYFLCKPDFKYCWTPYTMDTGAKHTQSAVQNPGFVHKWLITLIVDTQCDRSAFTANSWQRVPAS